MNQGLNMFSIFFQKRSLAFTWYFLEYSCETKFIFFSIHCKKLILHSEKSSRFLSCCSFYLSTGQDFMKNTPQQLWNSPLATLWNLS